MVLSVKRGNMVEVRRRRERGNAVRRVFRQGYTQRDVLCWWWRGMAPMRSHIFDNLGVERENVAFDDFG